MPSDGHDAINAFAENLPGAAFYYDLDADGQSRIQFLNKACEEIWSVTAEQIGSDPSQLWEMVHPDDLAVMQASVENSARELSIWEARYRIIDACGREKNLLSRGTPKARPKGGVRWLTFVFDITATARTEELFHRVTRQLDYLSKAIPDGFALFDPQERLVVCNAKFRAAYGLPKWDDYRGKSYHDILNLAAKSGTLPEATGNERGWIDEALERFRKAKDQTEQAWQEGRWMRVVDRPTEDGGRVAFRIEITEAVKRKRELERAAQTDAVTGLLNRRGLSARLAELEAECPADHRLVFLHLDLDKFKAINDIHGHETGDLVLVEISARLRALVDEAGCVARVGGDEFVVVEVSKLSDTAVLKRAEMLRTSLIDPVECRDRLCRIGATFGVAIWQPCGTETIEQVLIDADTALMAGKASGRNVCVQFTKNMRAAALSSASLASDIKEGIAKCTFEPFFQPQLAFPSRQVVGLEALARWRRADGRVVSAGAFIDVANETGLVTDIDQIILEKSLDLLSDLEKAGHGRLTVSVNLSAMQLGSETIVERLLDALFARGLSPTQVNIEVLETTLLDARADKIGSNINTLAEAGFKIELDDFGTGHTALASLTTFPVHRIKVDRSLIENIDQDRKKRAVVSGLYLVCVKLGIEALAEGVETAAELAVLRDIGYTRFQGYHFAKPLPACELVDWIDHWRLAG